MPAVVTRNRSRGRGSMDGRRRKASCIYVLGARGTLWIYHTLFGDFVCAGRSGRGYTCSHAERQRGMRVAWLGRKGDRSAVSSSRVWNARRLTRERSYLRARKRRSASRGKLRFQIVGSLAGERIPAGRKAFGVAPDFCRKRWEWPGRVRAVAGVSADAVLSRVFRKFFDGKHYVL